MSQPFGRSTRVASPTSRPRTNERIGGGPLRLLRGPDDRAAVPAAVYEAVGFYVVNVDEQDNGSTLVFRADVAGMRTYGALATTDGPTCHLEVYGSGGELLADGVPDAMAGRVAWQDREAVRRHAAM